MRSGLNHCFALVLTPVLLFNPAAVQAASRICVELEAKLVNLQAPRRSSNREVRRYNAAIDKQRKAIEKARANARRSNCATRGFVLFRERTPTRCGEVRGQVKKMEASLAALIAKRDRLAGGRPAGPRSARATNRLRGKILAALAENRCGQRYTRYARPNRRLANSRNPVSMFFRDHGRDPYAVQPGDAPRVGTFRTICVRTCDGYFWPVSFSTAQSYFADDEQSCMASCPGTDVALYAHRNPGEEAEEAFSVAHGTPYSNLPNAFKYRAEYVQSCGCKRQTEIANANMSRVSIEVPPTGSDFAARMAEALDRAEGLNRDADAEPQPEQIVIPLPPMRPRLETPAPGAVATITGMEDYEADSGFRIPPEQHGVRIVGPAFPLYR